MAGDGSQRQEQVTCKEVGTAWAAEIDAVSKQSPAVLSLEQDEDTDVGDCALLNRRDGAGVSAGDTQDSPTLNPSASVRKRRKRNFCSQDGCEVIKQRGSTVFEGLLEAAKAAEEWKASVLANIECRRSREEKIRAAIDNQKRKELVLLVERDELNQKIAAVEKRETLLLEVNGDLVQKIADQEEREAFLLEDRRKLRDKIATQSEREALLLDWRQKLLHEVDFRKKTKTLLIQERKELLKKLSGLKKREEVLEGYKKLAWTTADTRKKTKAVLLQMRKKFLNTIDSKKRTERILLQERREAITCLSRRIRAQKKKESQLLQECKNGEIRLSEVLDKLRYQRESITKEAINMLWDVTQKIFALTTDVEKSQAFEDKTKPPGTKQRLKMPRTVPTSWSQTKKVINRAQAVFAEAAESWKVAKDELEVMKIYCREGLVDKIIGRKSRVSEAAAALKHVLDESRTTDQRPQMKPKSLNNVKRKKSANPKTRGKRNNSLRVKISSSPSSQEARVCGKRKESERSGSSPPPSSEKMTMSRARRKPQSFGTGLPPPRERIRIPRERRRPQRYGTSP